MCDITLRQHYNINARTKGTRSDDEVTMMRRRSDDDATITNATRRRRRLCNDEAQMRRRLSHGCFLSRSRPYDNDTKRSQIQHKHQIPCRKFVLMLPYHCRIVAVSLSHRCRIVVTSSSHRRRIIAVSLSVSCLYHGCHAL